ncbi:hypothetical protein MMC19_002757 [Ptychographa xylographoides]|nr:hypothetical protein [Ptychographa xylographoides]
MVAEVLPSSYKPYKEDTNLFITWLSTTAQKCGYRHNKPRLQGHNAPLYIQGDSRKPPTGQLEGNARKEAKAEADKDNTASDLGGSSSSPAMVYTVTTRNLLEQAKAVATSVKPKVLVPGSILRAIRRAIRARERRAAWSLAEGTEDQQSTERHIHFINVLRDALTILEPQCESWHNTSKDPSQSSGPTCRVTKRSTGHSHNRFTILMMEDTDDDHTQDTGDSSGDTSEESSSPATSKVDMESSLSRSTKSSRDHAYELELAAKQEHTLSIFCTFED